MLDQTAAGVLLIAGGIGVTPMRTMFAECIERGISVTLLYSVRLLEDAAFLAEFLEVCKEFYPLLSLLLTVSPADKQKCANEVGPYFCGHHAFSKASCRCNHALSKL